VVVVRENVEGEYSEIGGRAYRGRPEVVSEMVTSSDSGVVVEHVLIDALAARAVMNPSSLDVIVGLAVHGGKPRSRAHHVQKRRNRKSDSG
jgi:isocitrate/isopropylmalate dehydrogenase